MSSADAVTGSFNDLWYTVALYVPKILAAAAVFIIGWLVATILYRIVIEIAKVLKVDEALRTAGVDDAAKEAGFKLQAGKAIATLVMWFVTLVFLVAALDILGLRTVTVFLQQVVLLYLPQVIIAALILIIAAIVADAVKNVIVGSARAAGAHSANLAGTVGKWAIWIFGVLAALNQLGIASSFIQILFTGFVIAISLALGLAFGLGGKEAAARTIDKLQEEIKREMR